MIDLYEVGSDSAVGVMLSSVCMFSGYLDYSGMSSWNSSNPWPGFVTVAVCRTMHHVQVTNLCNKLVRSYTHANLFSVMQNSVLFV